VDQEVAKTLGELELKLQELERELTSLGARERPRRQGSLSHEHSPHDHTDAPGMLVDEVLERDRVRESDPQEHTTEEAVADDDGFGGPAVWGGEEVPAQAGATVEHDWKVEIRETAYGEIPIPPPPPPDTSQAPWPPAPAPSYTQAPDASQTQWPPAPAPSHTQPVPHHPYAATPTERQSIDVADLVEFREKMRRTLDELIAEYSRLLSPKPPA
jgi:hypothetical protein